MLNYAHIISDFESKISKYIPGQSLDCVIISYAKNDLQVLLLQWENTGAWGLPGGFIYKDEDMEIAAARVLKERTGIDSPFLSQFYTFGDIKRRDIEQLLHELEITKLNTRLIRQWFIQRFITTGYLSLVNINECKPKPDIMSSKCEWVPLNKLPKLTFDHNYIVEKALERLKVHINYLPIGRTLLSEKFTMKDLQKLYESILQNKLDRGNFQRKMLKLKMLIRHEKQLKGGAHKAPFLYKFDILKYKELMETGIGFI